MAETDQLHTTNIVRRDTPSRVFGGDITNTDVEAVNNNVGSTPTKSARPTNAPAAPAEATRNEYVPKKGQEPDMDVIREVLQEFQNLLCLQEGDEYTLVTVATSNKCIEATYKHQGVYFIDDEVTTRKYKGREIADSLKDKQHLEFLKGNAGMLVWHMAEPHSSSIDSNIAELFANMKGGSHMVTLVPIQALENPKAGFENNTTAGNFCGSFFDMDMTKLDLPKTNCSVTAYKYKRFNQDVSTTPQDDIPIPETSCTGTNEKDLDDTRPNTPSASELEDYDSVKEDNDYKEQPELDHPLERVESTVSPSANEVEDLDAVKEDDDYKEQSELDHHLERVESTVSPSANEVEGFDAVKKDNDYREQPELDHHLERVTVSTVSKSAKGELQPSEGQPEDSKRPALTVITNALTTSESPPVSDLTCQLSTPFSHNSYDSDVSVGGDSPAAHSYKDNLQISDRNKKVEASEHTNYNNKPASESSLPAAAQEIDFDIWDPPLTPVCQPSKEPVVQSLSNVNENDVLLGRGRGRNTLIGNIRFQQLVQDFLPTYVLATKKEKSSLVRTIVLIVRKRGGHFLAKDKKTGMLHEVGDERAQQRTYQTRAFLNVRAKEVSSQVISEMELPLTDDSESAADSTLGCNKKLPPFDDSEPVADSASGCNKTKATESVLPAGAQEIDFDIWDPPLKPVCQPSTEPLVQSLSDLNQNDVFCGQGAMHMSGNKDYLKLIQEFQPAYRDRGNKNAALLARTILLIIRNRGGRFLRMDNKTGVFSEIGDTKAQAKIRQALSRTKRSGGTKKKIMGTTDQKKQSKLDHHQEGNLSEKSVVAATVPTKGEAQSEEILSTAVSEGDRAQPIQANSEGKLSHVKSEEQGDGGEIGCDQSIIENLQGDALGIYLVENCTRQHANFSLQLVGEPVFAQVGRGENSKFAASVVKTDEPIMDGLFVRVHVFEDPPNTFWDLPKAAITEIKRRRVKS